MRIKTFIVLISGVGILILLLPSLSAACPRCFASTTKQVLNAYYLSMAFMSIIPFGIIGSVLMWLYRQSRCHTIEQESR